jgi:Ni/Co efflux regulator RcnB
MDLMRKFLVSAAIVSLIAGSPALAQDREHHDQAGPPHGEQHGPQGGGAPHGAPPGPRPAAQPQPQRGGPPRGAENRGPQERQAPNNAMRGPEQRPAANNAMRGPEQRPGSNNAMRGLEQRPGANDAMRGPQGRPNNNNAMRGPSRDFSSARNYHQNFNATRRFHGPAYRPPAGYYARRWAWGMTLPSLFWARQYWLTDYSIYDLPPPPFGAIWVRVGSDALLIDQTSGMIIEVDYGVFY